ncbi:MAG: ABC transporter permease [Thermotoga sp.]|nr:MAG: ABC transporter permease [Thermotoga sp.]
MQVESSERRMSYVLEYILRKYGVLIATIVLMIIFSILSPRFMTTRNMLTLLRQISMLAIVSTGMTFVMAAGGFDMSVGYVIGLVNITLALSLKAGFGTFISLLLASLTGIAAGAMNGLLVAYVGLPDFIGTFAVGSIVYGLKMMITRGNPVMLWDAPKSFLFIGQGFLGPIPFPIIIMILILIFASFVMQYTRLGRRLYYIGGNPTAALYSGINIKWYRFLSFIISGLCVAGTSIVLTSRVGSGQPLAGEEYLLDAISAVFLGLTMFGEGEPNVPGTFVGAFLIGMLTNALTLMNVPYYFQFITKGTAVILAVMVSIISRRKE